MLTRAQFPPPHTAHAHIHTHTHISYSEQLSSAALAPSRFCMVNVCAGADIGLGKSQRRVRQGTWEPASIAATPCCVLCDSNMQLFERVLKFEVTIQTSIAPQRHLFPTLSTTPGSELPPFHAMTVSVPGAAQLWEDAVVHWGKLPLQQVLQPAIELAEHGFPVSPITAYFWDKGCHQLATAASAVGGGGLSGLLLPGNRAPRTGEVFKNPGLAATFRRLADRGAKDGEKALLCLGSS